MVDFYKNCCSNLWIFSFLIIFFSNSKQVGSQSSLIIPHMPITYIVCIRHYYMLICHELSDYVIARDPWQRAYFFMYHHPIYTPSFRSTFFKTWSIFKLHFSTRKNDFFFFFIFFPTENTIVYSFLWSTINIEKDISNRYDRTSPQLGILEIRVSLA